MHRPSKTCDETMTMNIIINNTYICRLFSLHFFCRTHNRLLAQMNRQVHHLIHFDSTRGCNTLLTNSDISKNSQIFIDPSQLPAGVDPYTPEFQQWLRSIIEFVQNVSTIMQETDLASILMVNFPLHRPRRADKMW